jgi:CheY-like chemotaxis protein
MSTFADSPRVLVVDDSPESTMVLEACLMRLGCEPVILDGSLEAVDEITTRDYDLIILDWLMPEEDGPGVLLRVDQLLNKLDPLVDGAWANRSIPVVVFSSLEPDEIDLPHCRHFNVLGCWHKSMSYPLLMKRVSEIVAHL